MELVQQVPLTVPATFSPESSFPAEVHGYSVSIRVLLAVAAVAGAAPPSATSTAATAAPRHFRLSLCIGPSRSRRRA